MHNDLSFTHTVTTIEGDTGVWIPAVNSFRYEAVGEAQNPHQMHRVVTSVQGRLDVIIPAWLIPEQLPEPAVIVWMLGGKVGYLPRELALRWLPVLQRLRAKYGVPTACPANVDPPSVANEGGYGVAVWLPRLPELPAGASRAPVAPIVRSAPPPLPPAARPDAPLAAPQPVPVTPPEELARIQAAIAAARKELASVEEARDIQSFGFYKPRYGFESSEQYVARLDKIKDEQKSLIKDGKAAACETQWTVGGSVAEGKKLVKQQSKLMLRAFNGECDAAIAKVRYDNVAKLEQRLTKAFEEVNKLGEVQQVFISRRYFDLRLAELYLVHEHREKVQEEKEEQKRIREQMREEQRAEEEIQKAKAKAEQDEAEKSAALEKAKADLAASLESNKQHGRLEALVNRLESELKDALERKAKAIARAQLTRSGHVYVLSNIGSFGDGVYKIGMTRRLDPHERVDELSGASVPFPFDIHAIIFAEDAPGLETKLHQAFAKRRVNAVNARKEYFRVTLEEIQLEVGKLHGLVTFAIGHEAEQYRKTLAALTALPEPPQLAPAGHGAEAEGTVDVELLADGSDLASLDD